MAELEPHYRMRLPDALPAIDRAPLHVVLDNIRSAYNVGSMFRTADAAGVTHVHLCGMTAYPPNHKLSKTALGAFDYVPWTHYKSTHEAIDALHKQGIPVVASEVSEQAISYTAYAWPQPVAVVFGNEVTGIGDDVLARCEAVVRVPMLGHKNTINVATVFGIVVYEIIRAWGRV